MPSRGAEPTSHGHVLDPDGHPLVLVDDDVLDVVHVAQQAHAANGVRLLAHDQPLPADVHVRALDAVRQLVELHAVSPQAEGVDVHVVLLGLAAEADDVDDARHLLELALEDPVLGGLEVPQRIALADDAISEDLPDGVPRREHRLHRRRELHELHAVDDFLPRLSVADGPGEVALDVAEPEERLRPNVVERRHPGEADLEGHGHVALDLLGAPAVGLGDDLDHRRDRVGVGLDVQPAIGKEPRQDEQRRRGDHDERYAERERDESLDHGRSACESGEAESPAAYNGGPRGASLVCDSFVLRRNGAICRQSWLPCADQTRDATTAGEGCLGW